MFFSLNMNCRVVYCFLLTSHERPSSCTYASSYLRTDMNSLFPIQQYSYVNCYLLTPQSTWTTFFLYCTCTDSYLLHMNCILPVRVLLLTYFTWTAFLLHLNCCLLLFHINCILPVRVLLTSIISHGLPSSCMCIASYFLLMNFILLISSVHCFLSTLLQMNCLFPKSVLLPTYSTLNSLFSYMNYILPVKRSPFWA